MTARRVLVLAQSFKESFRASAVGEAIAQGVREAGHSVRVLLASDGGDGLLEALAASIARTSTARARGPLGQPLEVPIGWLDATTAVIESRLVCGLSLVPPDARDPRVTSTVGVGDLVVHARDQGATHVVIGLGGSATMDGGVGFAQGLGWRFADGAGHPVAPGGGGIASVEAVEAAGAGVDLLGLCDVTNPLLGAEGAVVYARQKGATSATAASLAAALEHLVAVLGAAAARAAAAPGAGAAGGLGFGLRHFGGGTLCPGAPWVLDRVGLDEGLAWADAVVVAEGRYDATSGAGKLVGEGIARARRVDARIMLLAPQLDGAPPAGVTVETGGGRWDLEALAARARRAAERCFS